MAGTSKRQRVIPRGEEERWRWLSFGGKMIGDGAGVLTPHTVYADDHQLPGAGRKDGGKVAMTECCKMAFTVEPQAMDPAGAEGTVCWVRFAIQANKYASVVPAPVGFANGVYNIDELLDRPDVYWAHEECEDMPNPRRVYPVMYDVSGPNGQGIVFKGDHVWTSYVISKNLQPIQLGKAAYTWYCLCRTVWVDPAYYVQSTMAAANAS